MFNAILDLLKLRTTYFIAIRDENFELVKTYESNVPPMVGDLLVIDPDTVYLVKTRYLVANTEENTLIQLWCDKQDLSK